MPRASRSTPKSTDHSVEFPFQLVGLRIHELSVRRAADAEPVPKSLPVSIRLVSPTDKDPGTLRRQLLVFETTAPDSDGRACHLHLSIEARFEPASGTRQLKGAELADFEARHVIVLLWPYLRQFVFDITSKMELSVPPLPVVDPRALVASLSTPKPPARRRAVPKSAHRS